MRVRTATTTHDRTAQALAQLDRDMPQSADAAVIFYDCQHDAVAVQAHLRARYPRAALIGGSSHGGVLDRDGVAGPGSIGVLTIEDADGAFGAAIRDKGTDPAAAAEQAVRDAIDDAGCTGELPDLIWIYQSPGGEEAVLEGMRRVVGDRCPIVGGSSADDDLSGAWTQLGPDGVHAAGLAVMAFFPGGDTSVVFRGGYEPSGQSGVVTAVANAQDMSAKAETGRIITQIDGRPAAAVYNDWIGGGISQHLDEGGFILADTTMRPLAVETGEHLGVSQYRLIHPEAVLPGQALTTFADVSLGDRLQCMRGERHFLVSRAGSVVQQASADREDTGPPAGALVVYCGGCRMAIGAQEQGLAQAIAQAIPDAPFLACFTFGEQGPLSGRNTHGNLMISAVIFG